MVEPVRLVIWDLDETFWKGTLTEGGVRADQHAGNIVVALAKRGILSSVCSKNDFDQAKDLLKQLDVWDYFVFPSIDWTPKGPRVAAIVEAAQLRAETVLFVDDNPLDLQEARHFTPSLQIADQAIVARILDDDRFMGKPDESLARLASYRILEEKQRARVSAGGDVHGFLRDSSITVEFVHDVESHIDRAVELVNRTNQLNFTKQRLPEEPEAARAALLGQIGMFNIQAGLVRVRDKYGDYGLVGLYVQRKGGGQHELLHFCFSCRMLGMFVETWVYLALGRPAIAVSGEVLTDLRDESLTPDWIGIYEGDRLTADSAARWGRIFLVGGCDLEAVSHYLRPHAGQVETHFNIVRNGMEIRRDHSAMVARWGASLSKEDVYFLRLAGYRQDDFTMPPGAAAADFVLISFWADAYYKLFAHRDSGQAVPFSPTALNHHDVPAEFDEEQLKARNATPEALLCYHYLKAVAKGVGLMDEAGFKRNAARILAMFPDTTPIALMLMSELSCETIPDLLARHRAFNGWMSDVASGYPNVSLISVDACIREPDEISGPLHFHRAVYQRLASTILDQPKLRVVNAVPETRLVETVAVAADEAAGPEALVAIDPQAFALYHEKGAGDVVACFNLANILHMHGHFAQASAIYKRAYDLHSKSPGSYPLAQGLLQVRLLCQIKDRQPLDDDELAALRSLNTPFYNYICGAQLLANGGDARAAIRFMRNCYEEFHTGEEPDTIYLSGILNAFSIFTPVHRNISRDISVRNDIIPRNLFFYWDKNPPKEIAENFEYHRRLNHFNLRVFDKYQAETWLYETYGFQARGIFLEARHPAEAADILRVHVIHKYGGYWLDADIRLRSVERFEETMPRNVEHVFLTTRNGVVHNDFFGAVRNSEILSDCLLSLYRNCYLHRGLYIPYKTGPGVFARAINRIYYNAFIGAGPTPSAHVLGQQSFDYIIEEFPVTYKVGAGSWHNV